MRQQLNPTPPTLKRGPRGASAPAGGFLRGDRLGRIRVHLTSIAIMCLLVTVGLAGSIEDQVQETADQLPRAQTWAALCNVDPQLSAILGCDAPGFDHEPCSLAGLVLTGMHYGMGLEEDAPQLTDCAGEMDSIATEMCSVQIAMGFQNASLAECLESMLPPSSGQSSSSTFESCDLLGSDETEELCSDEPGNDLCSALVPGDCPIPSVEEIEDELPCVAQDCVDAFMCDRLNYCPNDPGGDPEPEDPVEEICNAILRSDCPLSELEDPVGFLCDDVLVVPLPTDCPPSELKDPVGFLCDDVLVVPLPTGCPPSLKVEPDTLCDTLVNGVTAIERQIQIPDTGRFENILTPDCKREAPDPCEKLGPQLQDAVDKLPDYDSNKDVDLPCDVSMPLPSDPMQLCEGCEDVLQDVEEAIKCWHPQELITTSPECQPENQCPPGYSGLCALLVDVLAPLQETAAPYLPTFVDNGSPGNGQTVGSVARWSIQLMNHMSTLTPSGAPSPLVIAGNALSGTNSSAQQYVAVGDVSIDVYEHGTITQEKSYNSGGLYIAGGSDTGPTDAEKTAMVAACIGLVVGALATGGWGGILLVPAAGVTCGAAYMIVNDHGRIACGFDPPSVDYGPQDWLGEMTVPFVFGESDFPTVKTVHYGPDGPLGNGSRVMVHEPWFENYDQGEYDCKQALGSAQQTAKEAMESYESNADASGAVASINAELDLSPFVPTSTLYQIQGNYLWSPVHGLVIDCGSTSCPLRLKLTVSSCGAGALVGGTPTEVKYLFDGDPTICPTTVTVDTGLGGTTLPVPVVLNMEAEGGGNADMLTNPSGWMPAACTGPGLGSPWCVG